MPNKTMLEKEPIKTKQETVYKYPMALLHALHPTEIMQNSYKAAMRLARIHRKDGGRWKQAIGYTPSLGLSGFSLFTIRVLMAIPIAIANTAAWKLYSCTLSRDNFNTKGFNGSSGHLMTQEDGWLLYATEIYDAMGYPKYKIDKWHTHARSPEIIEQIINALFKLSGRICYLPVSKNSITEFSSDEHRDKFVRTEETKTDLRHFMNEMGKICYKIVDEGKWTPDRPTGVIATHPIIMEHISGPNNRQQFRIRLNPLIGSIYHFLYLSESVAKQMIAPCKSPLPLSLIAFLARHQGGHLLRRDLRHFIKIGLGLTSEAKKLSFILADTETEREVIKEDICKSFRFTQKRETNNLKILCSKLKTQNIIVDFYIERDTLEIIKNKEMFPSEMNKEYRQQLFAKQHKELHDTPFKKAAERRITEAQADKIIAQAEKIKTAQEIVRLKEEEKEIKAYQTQFEKGIYVHKAPGKLKTSYINKYGAPVDKSEFWKGFQRDLSEPVELL